MKVRRSKSKSTCLTRKKGNLTKKRISRPAMMTPQNNPSESRPLTDPVDLRRQRRRSFAERNLEVGHPATRELTKKRVAIIKNFIRTQNSSAENPGVYGSEDWMDQLIALLDPKNMFDIIYADIQRWLRMEPIYAETPRKAVSEKMLRPRTRVPSPNRGSEAGNNVTVASPGESGSSSSSTAFNSDGNGNNRVAGSSLASLRKVLNMSVPYVSLTRLNVPAAPSSSKGCSAAHIPARANGDGALEGEQNSPLSQVAEEEQSPAELSPEEATVMRRKFYPQMKKKLDELVAMNQNIRRDDPNRVNEDVLRQVTSMVDSLARPGISMEDMRATLFHASTFVMNHVIISGPLHFGPGADRARASAAEP